jgi:hypothetical protein
MRYLILILSFIILTSVADAQWRQADSASSKKESFPKFETLALETGLGLAGFTLGFLVGGGDQYLKHGPHSSVLWLFTAPIGTTTMMIIPTFFRDDESLRDAPIGKFLLPYLASFLGCFGGAALDYELFGIEGRFRRTVVIGLSTVAASLLMIHIVF